MPTSADGCPELTAARRLAPSIAAGAVDYERARQLPADMVQSMVDADLVHMAIPQAYGGRESHLIDILRVLEEISFADASTGWCLMNYQTTAFGAALMQPTWGSHVFSGQQRCVPAGVLAPTGRATAVDGGIVVNGRWTFASGCSNANWLLATVIVCDADGEPRRNTDGSPQILYPVLPSEQFEIIDTWQVSGLCGSGSHDVEIRDAFVPEGRWMVLTEPPVIDTPLYRFPLVSTFPPSVAAVALGTARAAFDCFCEIAIDKVPFGVKTPLRQRGSAQIDVARAEAQIDSARSYVYETVNALWNMVEQGHAASDDAKRRVRLAGIHAAAQAASAVNLLYNAAGASAIADTCPLQRHFRDVHVITQHLHVSSAGYERMGKLRLTGETEGLL